MDRYVGKRGRTDLYELEGEVVSYETALVRLKTLGFTLKESANYLLLLYKSRYNPELV